MLQPDDSMESVQQTFDKYRPWKMAKQQKYFCKKRDNSIAKRK